MQGCLGTFDLFQDVFGLGGPDEGLGVYLWLALITGLDSRTTLRG